MQILVDTPATLSATWYVDGVVADPGAVTVTVTKADGTALYSDEAATGSGAAARTLTLTPADTAELDRLRVVWDSVVYGELVQEYEIVGALLFTIAELRAFRDQSGQPLTDVSKYPVSVIEEARSRITDEFEQILEYAPVPRYRRITLAGDGCVSLPLPDLFIRRLRSVETRSGAVWTAFTSEDLDDAFVDSSGELWRDTRGVFARGRGNIRVSYEYGRDQSNRWFLPLKRAAIILARYQLVDSNVSERTTSFSSEDGTFSLATAGLRGSFYGLPNVDSVLARASLHVPVVG